MVGCLYDILCRSPNSLEVEINEKITNPNPIPYL